MIVQACGGSAFTVESRMRPRQAGDEIDFRPTKRPTGSSNFMRAGFGLVGSFQTRTASAGRLSARSERDELNKSWEVEIAGDSVGVQARVTSCH